jgi:polysaccharide export outer membrane protein
VSHVPSHPSWRGSRALRALVAALALVPLGVLPLTLVGCSGVAEPLALPPPIEVTTLGVGDTFELRIVGEEKLPTTFTVSPDGTVDFPYIKRQRVAGLEPQQVAELVRKKLIEDAILVDPSVSVSMKEYNSKRVEIMGEIVHPGSLPLVPGMTLLRAVSIAGGLTAMAKKGDVMLRRRMKDGTTKAASISVQNIIDNLVPDPPLQAGDSIYVPQRAF